MEKTKFTIYKDSLVVQTDWKIKRSDEELVPIDEQEGKWNHWIL
jgi:hypothetical protein